MRARLRAIPSDPLDRARAPPGQGWHPCELDRARSPTGELSSEELACHRRRNNRDNSKLRSNRATWVEFDPSASTDVGHRPPSC
jgi:hypothetical protein